MVGRRGNTGPGTEVTLPITLMLDMSFQLLFFFISTFKLPSAIEGTLDLNLPSQATAMAPDPAHVDPSRSSQDAPPDLRVFILINVENPTQDTGSDEAVGDVKTSCQLKDKNNTSKSDTLSPPYSKDMNELTDKLKGYLDAAKDANQTISGVKLGGVSTLKWRAVVRVMDACRKAGLDDISFAAPPPADYAKYRGAHWDR